MNNTLCSLLAIATLVPAMAFAQQSSQASGTVTRAQVRAELTQLEAVGYRPSTHDADYPNALMAAEQKVAAMNDNASVYGGVQAGQQDSGTAHAVMNSTR